MGIIGSLITGIERMFTPSKSDKGAPIPQPPPLPPAPSPDTALADAQKQADDRRRAILATGGTTTTTTPAGAKLAPTQVAGKTLLGS